MSGGRRWPAGGLRSGARGASGAVAKLLDERFSCRAFLPTPVPKPTIESILAMAQRTASWCNAQPWSVVITSGRGTDRFRRLLRGHAEAGHAPEPDFPFPAAYRGVYAERRKACALQLYRACGIAREDREGSRRQALENFSFFGAPHAAIVTTERDLGVYGAVDCGAYVASFLLAAQSHGVATIPQAALAAYGPLVRAHFGLSASRRVVCGVSFGWADPAHPANGFRTPRAAVEDVATWVDE